MTTLNIKTVIRFGKYKNKTVAYLLRNDCRYLDWMSKNVSWIILSEYVKKRLDIAKSKIRPRSRFYGFSRSYNYTAPHHRDYYERDDGWPSNDGVFDDGEFFSANPYSPLDDGW